MSKELNLLREKVRELEKELGKMKSSMEFKCRMKSIIRAEKAESEVSRLSRTPRSKNESRSWSRCADSPPRPTLSPSTTPRMPFD